jgi:SAM-dependent methyltransferase
MDQPYTDYGFRHAEPSHMHVHFMPQVLALAGDIAPGTRVLDVGCGNGSTCGEFIRRGCRVVGVDLSEKGIDRARVAHPEGGFEVVSAESDSLCELAEPPFDLVISTEVVEHLYAPKRRARSCFWTLFARVAPSFARPHITATWKNLVISVRGHWDKHLNPLWDGGHIKLWSRGTLTALLSEAGFKEIEFRGAGRAPLLWMTMIMKAIRPAL